MLNEQLRVAGVACFPCWVRYDNAKQRYNKGPAVPRGESWQTVAQRPDDYPGLDWSSGVVGVPVPEGVVVIDRDADKGATESDVAQALGIPIQQLHAAKIQDTISGGSHYAFKCSWAVKQGDSIGMPGLDTRVGGKGFICSGAGYTQIGFGVFAFAHPHALPTLPDSVRALLEKNEQPTQTPIVKLPTEDERNTDQVIAALRYVDPGCSRSEWVRVGLALKQYYHNDESTGAYIFDCWSSGEYWPDGTPSNYVPEHMPGQWGSFKAEGDVTVATLFYKAIQGGWRPPSTFDTSAAFGQDAINADTFNHLVERIRANGCDIKNTQSILSAIQQAGCNGLQVALLAAELKTELNNAGVKDRSVSKYIDKLLSSDTPNLSTVFNLAPTREAAIRVEPGEHIAFENLELPTDCNLFGDDLPDAFILLSGPFANRLRVSDGRFFWWTGRLNEQLDDSSIRKKVAPLLMADRKKASQARVKSTLEAMRDQAQRIELDLPGPRVFFQNGVLEIPLGTFTHHHPSYGNTRTLAVDYDPKVPYPQWLAWLSDIFQSEPQRITLLQEIFGWLLVRHNFGIEKATLLIGPPRAGKGVIARSVQALLGSGATSFRINELDDPKLLAGMRGKNVAIDPDAVSASHRNGKSVMGLFKAITSNDPIALPLLYTQEPWLGQLNTKLLVLANSVPSMFDDSAATANRWVPLCFDRSYLGVEDSGLFSRLIAELPGIAAWAVEGLLRLVKRGCFDLPQSSLDQLDAMASDNGTVQDFIGDCLKVGEQFRCCDSALWDSYRQWAINSGHELGKRRHFLKALEDALRGSGVRRSKSVRLGDGRDYRGFIGVEILPVKTAPNVFPFRSSDS